MLSTLFKIGPIPIHSYGLCIAIGVMIGLWMMRRDCRKFGKDPELITDGAFWVLLLGLAGTRILHILMFPDSYSWKDPIGWIAIWRGGLVFQGALLPPVIYLVFYFRKRGISFWEMSDIIVPYLPLCHAFGRLGCFMNGCCYGARTTVPWAVSFPRVPFDTVSSAVGSPAFVDHCQRYSDMPADALWSFSVHPTQLYESALLFGICFTLVLIRNRWNPFTGHVMTIYLMLYGFIRFLIEFLRDDHNPTHFGGVLSDQQIFSLVFVALGVGLFLFLRKRMPQKAAPTP